MRQHFTSTCLLTIPLFASFVFPQDGPSLLEKRGAHITELVREVRGDEPPPGALPDQFRLVKYKSELGEMVAYMGEPERDRNLNEKHPAIVWLTGGFPACAPLASLRTMGDPSNGQSARIYMTYGMTMMFPTVRGSIDVNPGHQEMFYGEVNDVISAYEFLIQHPDVDKERVYLGGHSTGATLALLVAASTDVFAGVIALGPIAADYGEEAATYAWKDQERQLRAPIEHLASIQSPTFVVEGAGGNAADLEALRKANTNPIIQFCEVEGADHFDVIFAANFVFANAIGRSPEGFQDIEASDLEQCLNDRKTRERETADLETLSRLRHLGLTFDVPRLVSNYLSTESKELLDSIQDETLALGFELNVLDSRPDENGRVGYMITLSKRISLKDLEAVFGCHREALQFAERPGIYYRGWWAE